MNKYKEFTDSLKKGNYYIECPCGCDDSYPAKDLDFVFEKIATTDTDALEALNEWKSRLVEDEKKLDNKKRDQKTKTKTVVFGQNIEPLVPQIEGFKYDQRDCRYFNNPIDLIVFDGLHSTGSVKEIIISEIKSFDARLNQAQRTTREAVSNKQVKYIEY
ncbi:MAG: Holliday junction resolvase-like protein [Candidatus Pacebacteria bacterium]|jgi:predicted Holliday junction resolvase-like endonuclease|nr:Holliday junction resolvase-like protein [Candidatus Paceibacterota bacterium]MDP7466227.1 Holliday junction resolvase-like protein [Candidatus Paceibacterota bacterium]MDP7648355.1 Holliday junction resolvase-like protein [Candidatus Paceibacterota bacterium]|tara:strand:+ start:1148 stop:1627 length:480 start_codon:yes stop_codon:yes gene_type:complete